VASWDSGLGGPASPYGDAPVPGAAANAEDLSFGTGPRVKVWADAVDEECEGDLPSPASALAADASASQCPALAGAAPSSPSLTTPSGIAITPSARAQALGILWLGRGDPAVVRQVFASKLPDSEVDMMMKDLECLWN
jgi:hypothetical protein